MCCSRFWLEQFTLATRRGKKGDEGVWDDQQELQQPENRAERGLELEARSKKVDQGISES